MTTTPTTQREADERALFEAYAEDNGIPIPADYLDHNANGSGWFACFKAGMQAARAALAQSEAPAPTAWLATDLDGRGDVAFTKEEAKRRAGEGCTEFFPLYDITPVAAPDQVTLPRAVLESTLAALRKAQMFKVSTALSSAASPVAAPKAPASEQHDFKEHGGTGCALVECTRCGLYAEDAFDKPCVPAP